MKAPLISVIMPVYNAEKYLDESISSILNQTFTNFEMIIINDSSKDNSLKIIKRYQKKDKRVILIENKKNMGVSRTRNEALKISRGKYISIMDADDISFKDRLNIQFNFMEKNKDIFLCGGSAIVIDENGDKIGALIKGSNPLKTKRKLLKSNTIIHPSILFRNTKHYFYRDKFSGSEDYDLYLRILSDGGKIVNLKNFLIKYRISKNSFVSTKPYQILSFQKAKEFYLQRKEFGKDEYDSFILPKEENSNVNYDLLKLKTLILIKFQDNQMKEVRKEIKIYFNKYGLNKRFAVYYILSFLPFKFIKLLRKIF